MSTEKINGAQPSTVEWGGVGPAGERMTGRLAWLATDRPLVRGTGVGCAVAGFGMLVAAELLPWMSVVTSPIQQDFPTASGGRVALGLSQLIFVSTEMLNFGWLLVLAVVATALAVGPSARRIVVAAGLGVAAAQLALLAGVTRGVKNSGSSGLYRGSIFGSDAPVQLELGLYCAYGAVALFALALLLAGGMPRRLRAMEERSAGPADPALRGPADLTVTPIPTTQAGPDRSPWSPYNPDIDATGR